MQIGKHSNKWINSAARHRAQAKFRRNLCRILGWSFDCCATTGEILQSARERRV